MTTSLSELIAQREALDRQIHTQQNAERAGAIKTIQTLMAEFGLGIEDLNRGKSVKAPKAAGSKVAAKYRDAATGESWSGRGLKPKWLAAQLAAGKSLESFAV